MFGSKVKQLREQLGLTKKEYGLRIGKSESWVSRVEDDEIVSIKPGTQEKMAVVHNMTQKELRDYLFSKQGGEIFNQIQRINAYRNFQHQIGITIIPVSYEFVDGKGIEVEDKDEALMSIEDLKTVTNIDLVYGIRVKDNSLTSHGIKTDDCLFIDPNGVVEDGGMYFVKMNGERRVVKIYRHREGNIIVIGVTDGKYYEYKNSDIEICGRVIGFSGFHPL